MRSRCSLQLRNRTTCVCPMFRYIRPIHEGVRLSRRDTANTSPGPAGTPLLYRPDTTTTIQPSNHGYPLVLRTSATLRLTARVSSSPQALYAYLTAVFLIPGVVSSYRTAILESILAALKRKPQFLITTNLFPQGASLHGFVVVTTSRWLGSHLHHDCASIRCSY